MSVGNASYEEIDVVEKLSPTEVTVIDLGSYYYRFGVASAAAPERWRSTAGRPKRTLSERDRSLLTREKGGILVGPAALAERALLDMSPLTGEAFDWEAAAAFLSATSGPAAFVAAPLGVGPPTKRSFATFAESLLEVAFEQASLETLAVASATPLPLFALGRTHGLALQVGHRATVCANVTAGVCVTDDDYHIFQGCGGHRYNNLFPKGISSPKESTFVLPDDTRITADDSSDDDPTRIIPFSSFENLDVLELLFSEKPQTFIPGEYPVLGKSPRGAALTSKRRGPVDCLADVAWNEVTRVLGSLRNLDVAPQPTEIMISGGASLIPTFATQLETATISAAETKAVLNLSPRAGRLHPDDHLLFIPADDDAANWRGAAILASSTDFSHWVLKADYDEQGPHRAAANFLL